MLHKSLLAGLIFSGARPHYLEPTLEQSRNLPLDIGADAVESALKACPSARAVVLVSPSYVGVSSDLDAIAAICHASGVPLLVDEAWGPHFHFHAELPKSAMQSGADCAVSSTHKMLLALTQGSMLVARNGMLDMGRLHNSVDLVQTTSPSALIFASLDASRRQMALHGESLLTRAIEHARKIRDDIAGIDGLVVVGEELLDGRRGAAFDPTRIIVDVHELGLSGYDAEDFLRQRHGVYVEMSDLLSVMLLVTIGDDERSVSRVVSAMRDLVSMRRKQGHGVRMRSSGTVLFSGEQVMSPRGAYMAETIHVPVDEAVGRISAESITPYPPGIPAVMPGERLSADIIEYVRQGIAAGMYVSGLSDGSFQTVRVVR